MQGILRDCEVLRDRSFLSRIQDEENVLSCDTWSGGNDANGT
jgi:hypothetical protein